MTQEVLWQASVSLPAELGKDATSELGNIQNWVIHSKCHVIMSSTLCHLVKIIFCEFLRRI